MADARMEPLDSNLRSLIEADRELPPVPADVRQRLGARLEASRERGWRGPSDGIDELSRRRKWARRGVVAAVVAVAASVALALALGGSSAKERTVVEPAPEHERLTPDRDRALPSAARAKKRRALRFQLVDSSGAANALMDFVSKDARAQKLGVFVDIDRWTSGASNVHTDRYLRTAANGIGPCTWTITPTRIPDSSNECALSGREVLASYLTELYKRRPDLQPGAKHELVFEEVTQPRNIWRSHLVHRSAVVDGRDVKSATVVFSPTSNRHEVLVELYPRGAKRFAKATAAAVGQKLAMVVNGKVVSAPVVQSAITGGRATISMGGDLISAQRDAEALVRVLGATP